MSLKRRMLAAGAAVVMASAALVANAAPAQAATGNVWINFGSWNCPAGGSVVGIYWANGNLSSGPASGDWGDNVIYPRVTLYANNTISYQTMCKKWGWYTYRGVVSQKVIYPNRTGQSFWF